MARIGRPTKLNPQRQKQICHAIRLGVPYEMAAQAGGVGYDAFLRWMKRGAEGVQPYRDFYEAVKSAEAEALSHWMEVIENAATKGGDWKAAAWKAERRYPDHYSRRTNVAGVEDKPLTIKVVDYSHLSAQEDDDDG